MTTVFGTRGTLPGPATSSVTSARKCPSDPRVVETNVEKPRAGDFWRSRRRGPRSTDSRHLRGQLARLCASALASAMQPLA